MRFKIEQSKSKPSDWACSDFENKIFLDIRELFGKNLSRIRKKKNISIRELAVLSGLNKSTIVNIEKGRFSCTLDVQYKLATGLGVALSELFNF